MRQLTILTYEYVPDILERRGPFREEHLALLADNGCVMGGAVGDPPTGGVLVFEDRASAEAFVASDPYVKNNLVKASRIEPWTLAIG